MVAAVLVFGLVEDLIHPLAALGILFVSIALDVGWRLLRRRDPLDRQ